MYPTLNHRATQWQPVWTSWSNTPRPWIQPNQSNKRKTARAGGGDLTRLPNFLSGKIIYSKCLYRYRYSAGSDSVEVPPGPPRQKTGELRKKEVRPGPRQHRRTQWEKKKQNFNTVEYSRQFSTFLFLPIETWKRDSEPSSFRIFLGPVNRKRSLKRKKTKLEADSPYHDSDNYNDMRVARLKFCTRRT